MENLISRVPLALSAAVGFLCCLACSEADEPDEHDPVGLDGSEPTLAPTEMLLTTQKRRVSRATNNLTADRRSQLQVEADSLFKDLLSRSRGTPRPEHLNGAEEEPSDTDEEILSEAARAWDDFLGHVEEGPAGDFIVQDMSFPTVNDLLQHFVSSGSGSRRDKGLVVQTLAWPRLCTQTSSNCAPRLDVCWSSGNATQAQQLRVEELVLASWPRSTEVQIQFRNSQGNLNSCASTAPDGTWEIRIRHDSSANRGCSAIGSGSLSPSCSPLRGCSGSPPTCIDNTASMVLPTTGSAAWLDYTTVHEFGHAIGLVHEQVRLEYNWDDPNDPAPPGPRNCAEADADIGYIPEGLFIPTRLRPNDIDTDPDNVVEAQTVGPFDDDSIMYYCHTRNLALFDTNDARQSEISVGDINAAQFLYPTSVPTRQGIVRYSSWWNNAVRITFLTNTFNVSSTRTPATLNTNTFVAVGASYAASALALNGSRLRCSSPRNQAAGVFDAPSVSPPGGFTNSPVIVECYDPAGLATVSSSMFF